MKTTIPIPNHATPQDLEIEHATEPTELREAKGIAFY